MSWSRVTCHVSCVMCHMSRVTCHMSLFFFFLFFSFFFLDKVVSLTVEGLSSTGLPRLVSQSVWLKCALLCLPGSLDLDCSWTASQWESPKVNSLARTKYLHIFGIFYWQTLNCHYSSTVIAFDPIPKMRARPEYQLSSGSKYTAWLALAFHPDRNLLKLSA